MGAKQKDATAAKRVANYKDRLAKSGGKRLSLTLKARHVAALDALVSLGHGEDHATAARVLIEGAQALVVASVQWGAEAVAIGVGLTEGDAKRALLRTYSKAAGMSVNFNTCGIGRGVVELGEEA